MRATGQARPPWVAPPRGPTTRPSVTWGEQASQVTPQAPPL